MRSPGDNELARLLRWRPPDGVLSLYLDLDPADRGEGWRIELRNRLGDAVARQDDPGRRRALEATAKRMVERLEAEARNRAGRSRIGFVEVGDKPGRESWRWLQLAPRRTEIVHAPHPFLRPLLGLLDDGAPRGVAVLSAERARLLEWSLGQIEQIDDWEIELLSGDWRERKAQRVSDASRAQGVTASGRDQHGQRLDANRQRFLREVGTETARRAATRPWRELIAVGAEDLCRPFAEGLPDRLELHRVDGDLIGERAGQIQGRLTRVVDGLNRARELAIVDRTLDAARAEGGSRRGPAGGGPAGGGSAAGSLGPEETLEALDQGRVAHLLFDGEADDGLPVAERLIERALDTSAAITPVEGAAAERLRDHGGVAALLRY